MRVAALSSGNVSYFFAGTRYIRVTRGETGPGKVDPGYPKSIAVWGWRGFGKHGIDAALSSGTWDYFFAGNRYIRVTRRDAGAGEIDPGYPKDIGSWGFQGFGNNRIDAALDAGGVDYFFAGRQYIKVTYAGVAATPGWPKDVQSPDQSLMAGWSIFGPASRVTRKVDEGFPRDIATLGWGDFGRNGIDAALNSGSVDYFFEGNRYIRTKRSTPGAWTIDPGYPKHISAWGWPAGFMALWLNEVGAGPTDESYELRLSGTSLVLEGMAHHASGRAAVGGGAPTPLALLNQMWTFDRTGRIVHEASRRVLAVNGTSGRSVVTLAPASPTAGPAQLWDVTETGEVKTRSDQRLLAFDRDAPGAGAVVSPPAPGRQPTWTFRRHGPVRDKVPGTSLALNGADQYVSLKKLDFRLDNFTLEAWVRSSTGGPIFATECAGLVEDHGVAVGLQKNGSVLFSIVTSRTSASVTTTASSVAAPGSTPNPLDGGWHHVACVRAGRELSIYLDGVRHAADADPWRDVTFSDFLWGPLPLHRIGAARRETDIVRRPDRWAGFDLDRWFLQGEIDELRLWSRALAPREIAFGMHHLVPPSAPGLMGRWSFDGGDLSDSTGKTPIGQAHGNPKFVESEVDLAPPDEPYVITQVKLIQDWVRSLPGARAREVNGYRTVVSTRAADASPLASFVTLWTDEPCKVHFPDGTAGSLGPENGLTRRTDAHGELVFTIEAQSLTCPPVRIRPDFMAQGERLVVYPDRHAHATLGSMTGNQLLGKDESGRPLRAVTEGRRTVPVAHGTTKATADSLTATIRHVMSTAVAHDAQSEGSMTRSVASPEDVPLPRPYIPRYQDVALAASGYDRTSDAISTHFLPQDQRVVRIVIAENAPQRHCVYDHGKATFRELTDKELAELLSKIEVQHSDTYTRSLRVDASTFREPGGVEVTSDQLRSAAKHDVSARWGVGEFLHEVGSATKVVVTTVKAVATDVEEVVETVVAFAVSLDPVTGAEKALSAAVMTVEDAVGLAGALLAKVGAEIESVLDYIKDLFEWDDILLAHRVMEHYVTQLRPVLTRAVEGLGSEAASAIETFRRSIDSKLEACRGNGGATAPAASSVHVAAASAAAPPDVKSGYLLSMVRHNLDVGAASGGMDDYLEGLEELSDDLYEAFNSVTDALPDRLANSGLFDVLAKPSTLLESGFDVFLSAIEAVIDVALGAAEKIVTAMVAFVERLIDALYKILEARIEIPFVTDFYETVVMKGTSPLTVLGLLTLIAAVPSTVVYKAVKGVDEPLFTKAEVEAFEKMNESDFTWIRNRYLRPAAKTARYVPNLSPWQEDRLNWSMGFINAFATLVWGVTTTASDMMHWAELWRSGPAPPPKVLRLVPAPKREKPIAFVDLGAQVLCFVSGAPWSQDVSEMADQIGIALWASAFLPMCSNLAAAAKPTGKWSEEGDPKFNGVYGVIAVALSISISAERGSAGTTSQEDLGLETSLNLAGSLTWVLQLSKWVPPTNKYVGLVNVIGDITFYATAMALGIAKTARSIT